MLSLSKWRVKKSKLRKTWAHSSKSIRRLNPSSTRTMCRPISSRHSRRESSARRNTFRIQISAWCQTWRRSTNTLRSSSSSRKQWWASCARPRGTSRITVKTTATRWRSSRTCDTCSMSRLGRQPMAAMALSVTKTRKPEDLTGSSSETETESQIDTITSKTRVGWVTTTAVRAAWISDVCVRVCSAERWRGLYCVRRNRQAEDVRSFISVVDWSQYFPFLCLWTLA